MSHLSWQYGLAFSAMSLIRKSNSLPNMSPFKRSSSDNRPSNRDPSSEARRPTSIISRPPRTSCSPSETAACCSCKKNWGQKNREELHKQQENSVSGLIPQFGLQAPCQQKHQKFSKDIKASCPTRLRNRMCVNAQSAATLLAHSFNRWWLKDPGTYQKEAHHNPKTHVLD